MFLLVLLLASAGYSVSYFNFSASGLTSGTTFYVVLNTSSCSYVGTFPRIEAEISTLDFMTMITPAD